MPRNATAAIDRMLARIDPLIGADGCWEWPGARVAQGYGRIWSEGRTIRVHRLSYQEFVGPIAEGLDVLHHCDNPPCWRPSHLFAGTALDNAKDRVAKGRQAPQDGERSVKIKNAIAEVVDAMRRVAAGERQCDVAASLSVAQQTVSDWIRGRRRAGAVRAFVAPVVRGARTQPDISQ